ncbi:MAG: hypothetical protein EBW30_00235, partial [Synechococcaceae bacterium WB7_3xG_012]|nr:hypothetical protein [Synechococcaceae bacterium WB7_3xG_012]
MPLILLQRVGCEAIEHAGGQCVALSLAGGLQLQQESQHRARERYSRALTELPHDGFCFAEGSRDAKRR